MAGGAAVAWGWGSPESSRHDRGRALARVQMRDERRHFDVTAATFGWPGWRAPARPRTGPTDPVRGNIDHPGVRCMHLRNGSAHRRSTLRCLDGASHPPDLRMRLLSPSRWPSRVLDLPRARGPQVHLHELSCVSEPYRRQRLFRRIEVLPPGGWRPAARGAAAGLRSRGASCHFSMVLRESRRCAALGSEANHRCSTLRRSS